MSVRLNLKAAFFALLVFSSASSSSLANTDTLDDLPLPPEMPPADAGVFSQVNLRDPRIPLFQSIRPQWGIELSGAAKGLGGSSLEGKTANAFSARLEWQPDVLQDFGIVGVGPSVNFYPIFADNRPTSSPVSVWSIGGQVRYQARLFREQPLVPVVGYAMESLAYRFDAGSGSKGRILVQGPVLGAMVYMNLFEPSSAAEFYVTQGVLRSYLVGELRLLTGNDANLAIDGKSLFVGLRFEL